MQQYQFTSIKILKDGVTIKPLEIEDTDDHIWQLGDIESDKPASDAMNSAMQSFAPEVQKRLELMEDEDVLEKITVQGITIKYKDGYVGIKIHFRIDNNWFTGPVNSHLPFVYQSSEDLDSFEDPDDAKPFLTTEMIENLDELCKATEEYLKVKPKDRQLSLFSGTQAKQLDIDDDFGNPAREDIEEG